MCHRMRSEKPISLSSIGIEYAKEIMCVCVCAVEAPAARTHRTNDRLQKTRTRQRSSDGRDWCVGVRCMRTRDNCSPLRPFRALYARLFYGLLFFSLFPILNGMRINGK